MYLREQLFLVRAQQPLPLAFHTAQQDEAHRSAAMADVLRDMALGVAPGNPPVSEWEQAQRAVVFQM